MTADDLGDPQFGDTMFELAEDFRDAVGPGGAGPDRALLAEVARAWSDQLRDLLLGVVMEVTEEELHAGRKAASHLGRLARLLPDAEASALRTGAHLLIGEAAAKGELWVEAAGRLVRARRGMDEGGPFAALIPGCELQLGNAVDHLDRRTEAVAHWTAARSGFLDVDEWSGAAAATAMLAWATGEGGDLGRGTVDRWGEAADLAARAGEHAEARDYATRCCGLGLPLVDALGERDPAGALRLAVVLRAVADRHGAADVAPGLALRLAVYGADAGWEWSQVRRWCDTARREWAAQQGDDAAVERSRAMADLVEGVAAVGRGLVVEAEAPLRAALEVARRRDMPSVEQVCVRMLGGVHGVIEQADLGRLADLLGSRAWDDPEGLAGALLVRALRAQQSGTEDADALLAEARTALTGAGPDAAFKLVALDLMTAVQGEPDDEAIRRALARAEAFLADPESKLFGTAVRGIRIVAAVAGSALAARTDGPRAAADALVDVETLLLESGSGVLAAQVALNRAGLLLDGGHAQEALDVALPAVVAVDAVRCTLDDADRRRRWTDTVARGVAVAFRAAAAAGAVTALAELIEVARGNADPSAPRRCRGARRAVQHQSPERPVNGKRDDAVGCRRGRGPRGGPDRARAARPGAHPVGNRRAGQRTGTRPPLPRPGAGHDGGRLAGDRGVGGRRCLRHTTGSAPRWSTGRPRTSWRRGARSSTTTWPWSCCRGCTRSPRPTTRRAPATRCGSRRWPPACRPSSVPPCWWRSTCCAPRSPSTRSGSPRPCNVPGTCSHGSTSGSSRTPWPAPRRCLASWLANSGGRTTRSRAGTARSGCTALRSSGLRLHAPPRPARPLRRTRAGPTWSCGGAGPRRPSCRSAPGWPTTPGSAASTHRCTR